MRSEEIAEEALKKARESGMKDSLEEYAYAVGRLSVLVEDLERRLKRCQQH